MYKIAFFCIPAHGHTNPTLAVVRELTRRGCEVRYYSYLAFREKIEESGAVFISCDEYGKTTVNSDNQAQVAFDLACSIHILTDTALALDEMICRTLKEFQPDCIVADSMAVWGKFAAYKLGIPFVSSTTTFAFNRFSARIMKPSLHQMLSTLKSLPDVHRDLKRLKKQGYPVKNFLSILQNEVGTPTIVYTSKEFQPCSDTFSDKYAFVGPSVCLPSPISKTPGKKLVYISMGTVNNRLPHFYQNCLAAFSDEKYAVILSVGNEVDISSLGTIPPNCTVEHQVNQLAILQQADVFLSHCGMNSVSESLYCGVPLVLFPQTQEQSGVANRVLELGAGLLLKEGQPESIRKAVEAVLSDPHLYQKAAEISESFHRAGGAYAAAEHILQQIKQKTIS